MNIYFYLPAIFHRKSRYLSCKCLLLSVLFMISSLKLIADDNKTYYDFKVDGIYYAWLEENGEATDKVEVKFGEGDYSGDIVIPSHIEVNGKTYTVIQIGGAAFYNTEIRSVRLPNTITAIGPSAFSTTPVTEIELNEGLIMIGCDAFTYCKNLTKLHFPSTLQYISFYNRNPLDKIDRYLVATSIEKISVAPENPYFTDVDGVVFSKDMKNLVLFPPNHAKTNNSITYRVPDGVEKIWNGGFFFAHSLSYEEKPYENIILPKSLKATATIRVSKNLYFQDEQPPLPITTNITDDIYDLMNHPNLIVPIGAMDNYAASETWKTAGLKSRISEMDMTNPKTVHIKLRNENGAECTLNETDSENLVLDVFEPLNIHIRLKPYKAISNAGNLITRQGRVNWFNLNEEPIEIDKFEASHPEISEGDKTISVTDYDLSFIPQSDCRLDVGIGIDATSFTCQSENGNIIRYQITGDSSVSITSIQGNPYGNIAENEIILPDEVNFENKTYRVTDIISHCGITDISKLNIASSIKRIGSYALSDSSLTEVSFSEGLESIGSCSFEKASISSVNFPKSLKSLGDYLFNSKLKKANIPPKIDTSTFSFGWDIELDELIVDDSDMYLWNCPTAKKIVLGRNVTTSTFSRPFPDEVEEIIVTSAVSFINDSGRGQNNLKSLKSLTVLGGGRLEIAAGSFYRSSLQKFICEPTAEITSLGHNVFAGCKNLSEVILPDKVGIIENGAFYDCDNLTDLRLPVMADSIQNDAFRNCSAVKSVTIPSGLRTLTNTAFNGCTSLEEVIIADSNVPIDIRSGAFSTCPVKNIYIGREIYSQLPAFFRTETLERIELGEDISELRPYAFGDCRNLREIHCRNANPPKLGQGVFRNVDRDKCKVITAGGNEDSYRNADTWKEFFESSGFDDVIFDNDLKISAAMGEIHISGPQETEIKIYKTDGTSFYSGKLKSSELTVSAPQGLYIISAGKTNKKIMVL